MRNIIVTGCSSGIGRHCAIRLKENGWRVFATARSKQDLAALEEIGLNSVYLDYCDEDSISSCFYTVMEKTGGKLDALFNNGAYGQAGAVEDIKTNVLRAQFEANFFGWHTLTNLAVPAMRAHGKGRIVHCSSILGWVPLPWRGAYNASKYALEGLVSTMRLELRGSGIHVCLIEPGPIESKFGENGLDHFVKNIDVETSVHSSEYQEQLKRLSSGGGENRFRLKPEAVYKKLDHALNSADPKAHYGVTLPTHVLNIARRVLPQSILDAFLVKNG